MGRPRLEPYLRQLPHRTMTGVSAKWLPGMPTCNTTQLCQSLPSVIGLCIRQAFIVYPTGLSKLLPPLGSWEGVAQGSKLKSDLL